MICSGGESVPVVLSMPSILRYSTGQAGWRVIWTGPQCHAGHDAARATIGREHRGGSVDRVEPRTIHTWRQHGQGHALRTGAGASIGAASEPDAGRLIPADEQRLSIRQCRDGRRPCSDEIRDLRVNSACACTLRPESAEVDSPRIEFLLIIRIMLPSKTFRALCRWHRHHYRVAGFQLSCHFQWP